MEMELVKTVKLSATIKKNGELVMGLNAEIANNGEGTSNDSRTTYNQKLYDENRAEIRKKIAEFDTLKYSTEDEFSAEFEKK